MLAAQSPAGYKSRLLQDLDVLGNGIQGHVEMSGKRSHSQRPFLNKERKDLPPRGVARGLQNT